MYSIKWRYLYILLLGLYSFLNIKFTQGDAVLSLPIPDLVFCCIILVIVLVIWEANHLLEYFNRRIRYKRVSLLLIRHFVASVLLVSIISPLFVVSINYFLDSKELFEGFNQLVGFTFRINLFLQCINAIIVYNKELSSTKIEAETLKKETTEAQFDALRRQINPHFLFNSFNVLSSVIENDQKLAVQFVEQLSKVYRYLLRTQDLKTVALEEEVDFINSYVFLLKIRFGSNLNYEESLMARDGALPPASLQLLIENAIKHNEVSKSNPLTISLERQNGELVVTNNKNPKVKPEISEGVGLSNIQKRYQLLGVATPEILDNEKDFTVKLPLIK